MFDRNGGSNGGKYGSNSPLKVTYCVHGRPSAGCCTVTEDSRQEDPNAMTATTREVGQLQHCHGTSNTSGPDRRARRQLIAASVLCLVFMCAETVGGYLSGSLAIATDAAHLLTDFASFMVSLFALWVGGRPATRRMPFGWYRAEVIGALTSVLMIWVVVGVLVYLAVERCLQPDFEIDPVVMLITSGIGVIVNLLMGCTLHQHGHTHGHGHDRHERNKKTEKQVEAGEPVEQNRSANINVRAAYVHVLGDLVQSLGVLLAAAIIFYRPDWKIVDPICTFVFSLIVLATTFTIVRDALQVLMEGLPKGIDFTDVINTFLNIEGVERVHNLRIWALSLDKVTLSAHLAISKYDYTTLM